MIDYKSLKLKWTNRAIMIFEQITGKAFEIKTNTDSLLFFYCVIIANNHNISLDFDTFIDDVDDNQEILSHLNNWLNDTLKQKTVLASTGEEKKKIPKKKLQP